jgi:arabinosaccharide transport system permease protein
MKNFSTINIIKIKTLKTILLIFSLTLAAFILVPLLALLISTFKPGQEIMRNGLNLKVNFQILSFDNWIYLFTGSHSFFKWFFNSLGLTIVQVFLILFVGASVAYGFSIYDFKIKNILFICVLIVMMLPFEILMLPLYKQTIGMGLIDTWAGIILPFVANASTIFFFRQYLESIPFAIIDAGRIDGANEYVIFGRLILPIIKPAFAAMVIYNGMRCWNDFLWPLMVLKTSEKFILPIGLNTLLTPYGNNYDLLFVGSFFSIIPIFIVFISFQQYFIDGMTAGSVKG